MAPLRIGYWLSSEEHDARTLVRTAQQAEANGFDYAMISDHFHPWIDRQGQSPFVWAVIGGIAATTERIELGTGVTCPLIRMHPAIVAHAAATAASMMPGRFLLGLGTGENLNEHVVGRGWPEPQIRMEMFREAVAIIRLLFEGGMQSYRGRYYTLEDARLYSMPETPPPIAIAAGGQKSAEMAGELGDALITTGPDQEIVKRFEGAGGKGKPKYASFHAGWARTAAEGRKTVHRMWPTSAIPGNVNFEIRLPKHFEELTELVTEEAAAKKAVLGPDPEPYVEKFQEYVDAGFDHVSVHNVGDDQEGFITFIAREVMPEVRARAAR